MNVLALGVVLAVITTQGNGSPQILEAAPVQVFDCTQDCDKQGKIDSDENITEELASQQIAPSGNDTATLIVSFMNTLKQALENAQSTNNTTNLPNTEENISVFMQQVNSTFQLALASSQQTNLTNDQPIKPANIADFLQILNNVFQQAVANSPQTNITTEQSNTATDFEGLIQALNSSFQQAAHSSQSTNVATDPGPSTGSEITSSTRLPVDGSFWWETTSTQKTTTSTSTIATTTTEEVTPPPVSAGSIDGSFWWQTTSAQSQTPDSTTPSVTLAPTTSTTISPVQTTEISSSTTSSTTTSPTPLTSTEDPNTFIDAISSNPGDEFITGSNANPSSIGVSVSSHQASPAVNDQMADCTCVPYHQCNDPLETISNLGIFNISGSDPQCERRKLLDVCCFNPAPLGESSVSSTSFSGSTFSTSSVSGSSQPRCGQRNKLGVDVHINNLDNEVQYGEFPWMVAVLRRETIVTKDVQLYQCGGSLIQPDIVLTAAHCVFGKDPNRWQIRAGEWDVRNKYEIYGHQDADVSKVLIHPKYNPRNLHNNYAILYLAKPLTLQPHISPICLPRPGYVFPDNTTCYASGWGKTSAGKDGVYQIVQRKVELPLVHNARCQEYLRTTRLGPHFRLANEFICAGGIPGRDTCKGDGGAPLVCELPEQPGVYVQAGTVAWGIGCGEDGIPGVYADVAKAIEWIDEATESPERVGRIWEGY